MRKKFLFILLLSLFLLPGLAKAYEPLNQNPSAGEGGVWNLMRGGGEQKGESASGTIQGGLNAIQGVVYENEGQIEPLPVTIFKIVRIFLGLLGTIFLALIIYAGFLWMTAGGNEEQITKAKKLLQNAVIGLAIIFCAYAISLYVSQALVTSTAT